MKTVFLILFLIAGALSAQRVIHSISPSSVDPGTENLTLTFTLPGTTPPTPPANVQPTSVTIGSITGTSPAHTSLDTVTAIFDFPEDATEGNQTVVITFPTPNGQVEFSNSSLFSIGQPSTPVSSGEPPAAGYNLVSPVGSKDTWLLDKDGGILRTWTSEYGPALSTYLMENGNLVRTSKKLSDNFGAGGGGGIVEIYDWEGNLVWFFDYDSGFYRLHHDIEVLPDGNILMIAWELKSSEEAESAGRDPSLIPDGELWPDHIIEVQPSGSNGGEIVWEWHVWDHLVQDFDNSLPGFGIISDHPGRIDLNHVGDEENKGVADWNHINSIDYNPELDQILLCVRNFSEIWVIDHGLSTIEAAGPAGDLLYRWGNPDAYSAGSAADQKLFVQHDAEWIDPGFPGEGNILIFNNGEGRSDGDYSSVVEIVPPVSSQGTYTDGLPVDPVWSYSAEVLEDFYASHISSAQRLRNGNTLIADGPALHAFEVNPEGELIWEYFSSGQLFRFERYAPDYVGFENTELALPTTTYTIVDTAQDGFYSDTSEIPEPGSSETFYGQDASYSGNQPNYEISPDRLTVYDYNTGLSWTRSHDLTGDGLLNAADKLIQSEAVTYAAVLNANEFGGYSDWRLPSIKELYSLMDFRGVDPAPTSTDVSSLTPFIDTNYFDIGPGDLDAGDRIIDSQFATTTIYVDTVMNGQEAMFGLNLMDGRIKGYPTQTGKTYYAYYCRGNPDYGLNAFHDNKDGTVTDYATGLMWAQTDDGNGMDWGSALAYAEGSELADYNDWRLPNTKELQSIVDYTRSPGTTDSAAIDPVFSATQITNMAGQADYPWYWSGTTHLKYTGSADSGSYVCFGRGTGTMDQGATIIDVHGAGCQRSDPKSGNPIDYPSSGHGPQGDVRRVYNFVRLVRDADLNEIDPTSSLQGIIEVIGDGWIEHDSLGLLWGDGGASSAWFYSPNFGQAGGGSGWLWTADICYPYFYRFGDGHWLWHIDTPLSQCWFYELGSASFTAYDWIANSP